MKKFCTRSRLRSYLNEEWAVVLLNSADGCFNALERWVEKIGGGGVIMYIS